MLSKKSLKTRQILTDEQDTGTDETVYGIKAPGEGIINETLSPLAKTDLSRASVNYILEFKFTQEGVGTPITLKNLGALQL